MNAVQIEAILRRSKATRRFFLGCFAADQIPSKHTITNYPVSMIINLDPARKDGSHWVAAFLTNVNSIIFWDSLALPIDGEIAQFLASFEHVERNKKAYQNPISDVCGQHCVVFLHYISLGYTFKKFLAILNYNAPDYDGFVRKFVNKMIA
jgi:hypothetical protein